MVPRRALTASTEAAVLAAPRPTDDPKRPLVAGIPVNYDEALVGTYKLPDPLLFQDGKPVYVLHRRDIESREAPEIARILIDAFDRYCVKLQ